MRAENIATVTVTLDGRLTYKPTERFIALGMTEVDLERIPVMWRRSLHVGSNWRIPAG
jgi:hypothetical protein